MSSKLITRIQNLIELATHNPNEEEGRSAAMAAVKLIEDNKLSLDGAPAIRPTKGKAWQPDNAFDEVLDRMKKKTDNREEWETDGNRHESGLVAAHVEEGLDEDFMRKLVVRAWRQMRAERKRLEAEVHEFRNNTRRPDFKTLAQLAEELIRYGYKVESPEQ